MAGFSSFVQVIKKSKENKNKKIKSMKLSVVADKFIGDLNVTDIQLQDGEKGTTYSPKTSELLKTDTFGINENEFLNTVNNPVKLGVQPRVLTGLKNRIFNVMGRGHEVISIPNVYHEDYKREFCTTNFDITITPKNDYDLLRISTNDGAYFEKRAYQEEELKDNPLNKKYSREFFFDGGKKGDVIKLLGSEYKASKNNQELILKRGKIVPLTNIDAVQRFMVSPSGTFRVRIEFYKLIDKKIGEEIKKVYEDVGIGFNCLIEFKHIEMGGKF